jgi:KDO2-lipid IV(A) lauroyltransferase
MMVVETAMAWWGNLEKVEKLCRIEGVQHLETALQQHRGVILLGGHFTTLDLGGTLLGLKVPHVEINAVYRPHENPVLEYLIVRGRRRVLADIISRNDTRSMIRHLRKQHVVWTATDQDYALRNSVFAPFFGVPAATTTAISRLASVTGAAVVPFSSKRLENGQGYLLQLLPPLDNFPGKDVQRDTERVNKALEDQVRTMPEQYYWVHRRFKHRPPGEPALYS